MDNCMLCSSITKDYLVNNSNNFKEFLWELKYDGIRSFIYIENHRIAKIISRAGRNITPQFPEFRQLNFDFVSGLIDSEIIVENGKEGGDFNSGISLRTHLTDSKEITERSVKLQAKIMAFDFITLNGEDLRFKPLIKRKDILKENIKDNNLLGVVAFYEDYKALWDKVEREQQEGIIAKHRNSAYEFVRSKLWIKCKNFQEKIIEFNSYDTAVSSKGGFYKGITLKNDEGDRVACMGKQSEEVKRIIDERGNIKVVVQYLEKTKEGRKRFISFKEIAK